MTDEAPPRKPEARDDTRSKSDKRKRTKLTAHRWLAEEFNEASANAQAAGLSFGAYVRSATTGKAGDRAQRRLPVEAELLRLVLSEFGRYGNNMNQIAYQLNARGDRAGAVKYEEALHEWAIIRRSILDALGKPSSLSPSGGTIKNA